MRGTLLAKNIVVTNVYTCFFFYLIDIYELILVGATDLTLQGCVMSLVGHFYVIEFSIVCEDF